MKIDEKKYPFKWMLRALEAFNGVDTGLSSFQIARTIGSCSPDASEVLKMLTYLTSFGRVIEFEGKWKIVHSPRNSESVQSGYRIDYINGLLQLIESLSNNYDTIGKLTKINGRDPAELQKELSFLSQITEKGQVYVKHKRFPQKFAIKSWQLQ